MSYHATIHSKQDNILILKQRIFQAIYNVTIIYKDYLFPIYYKLFREFLPHFLQPLLFGECIKRRAIHSATVLAVSSLSSAELATPFTGVCLHCSPVGPLWWRAGLLCGAVLSYWWDGALNCCRRDHRDKMKKILSRCHGDLRC